VHVSHLIVYCGQEKLIYFAANWFVTSYKIVIRAQDICRREAGKSTGKSTGKSAADQKK